MPELPGLWSLTPLGGMLGMVVILYWLLATGRLISRSAHERELGQERRRGDEWKETALETRKLAAEQSEQISVLVVGTKTAAQYFGTVGGDHAET